MEPKTIIFDKSAKREILDLFGKAVGPQGFIVEKENPAQKVLSPDGEEIKFRRLAAITKGSEAFISSDLISLLRLADKL